MTLTLTLAACAAQQLPAPPPLKLVNEAAPSSEASPPSATGAQLLAQQPPKVQEAIKEHQQGGKWPVYKTPELVRYPYGEGPEPIADCAPLRTTDIELQPGETITDVAIGDTERWMATPAASGDPRTPVPHLAVKPQATGIETNLTIYTTKHIYHMLLRSRGSHAMQEVEFYYPRELLTAMKDADSAAAKSQNEAVDPPGDSDNVVKVANVDPRNLTSLTASPEPTFHGSRFAHSMTVPTCTSRCHPE
jgi:type IV secretory pathway VirB9-like protein